MKHFILIGFKSSGKSLLGKELAKRISASFVDLDIAIEQAYGKGVSCREIMAREGELFFRKLETKVLAKVLRAKPPCILALGGGTVLAGENQKLLAEHFKLYLSVDSEVLFARIKKGGRPAFFGAEGSDREMFEKLYREREPLYRRLSDATVDNSGTPEEAIQKLVTSLDAL